MFEDIKYILAWSILSDYPDCSKKIEIHTDASDFQLGVVIIQEVKPIVLYNKKLASPKKVTQ